MAKQCNHIAAVGQQTSVGKFHPLNSFNQRQSVQQKNRLKSYRNKEQKHDGEITFFNHFPVN
ncbi:MAG: hypothetical protein GY748_16920 [Planctomycetaceae bacterium]|nr:hypothetical protein [Planctomycetaceae bacterium]